MFDFHLKTNGFISTNLTLLGATVSDEKPVQKISVKTVCAALLCFANDAALISASVYRSLSKGGRLVIFYDLLLSDTSGVVFDTRSKMVMSQGGTTERMKEKVGHGRHGV